MIVSKMDLLTRCHFGGAKTPKPPPPPPAPPSKQDAARAAAAGQAGKRKPQGYASTILTGGQQTPGAGIKNLLGL